MTDAKQALQPAALEATGVTFYALGGFGYRRTEARSLAVRVAPYAQFPRALHVTFTEKGKRKVQGFVETSPRLLVLADYGHPLPPNAMTNHEMIQRDGCEIRTSVSRWTCFAPEWALEFDRIIDPYIAQNQRLLLADYRGFDTRGVAARAAELRAGAMLEAGDRVVTPSGPGVVLYRRMAPPNHMTPLAFSVNSMGGITRERCSRRSMCAGRARQQRRPASGRARRAAADWLPERHAAWSPATGRRQGTDKWHNESG